MFGTVLNAYRADHDGLYPPGYLVPPITDDNQNPLGGIAIDKILIEGGYMTERPVCPTMRLSAEGRAKLKKGQTERQRLAEIGSYGLNAFIVQTKPINLPGPYWGGWPYPGDHRMLFVAETYYCGLYWSLSQTATALKGVDFGGIYLDPRHHGGYRLHFMFLDGHVEAIAPKVLEDGTFDWDDSFDSWGRNNRWIGPRRARE